MLSRDKEIQSLADTGEVVVDVMLLKSCGVVFYTMLPAVKMCQVEVGVVRVKEELAARRLQINRLQSRLRDAEKILVSSWWVWLQTRKRSGRECGGWGFRPGVDGTKLFSCVAGGRCI